MIELYESAPLNRRFCIPFLKKGYMLKLSLFLLFNRWWQLEETTKHLSWNKINNFNNVTSFEKLYDNADIWKIYIKALCAENYSLKCQSLIFFFTMRSLKYFEKKSWMYFEILYFLKIIWRKESRFNEYNLKKKNVKW